MEGRQIFVTGGAGYVGAVLVPKLLDAGNHVTVLDLMIYGADVLPNHSNLDVVCGDVRDEQLLKTLIPENKVVIHLACISNDPSFELNPELGKSINLDAFRPLVTISRNSGVERFIYASSSSVYGIKNEENVHENMILAPLTDYSRYKADCEKILHEYQSENFTTVTIRPATVCGYSPRQRLDVVVNILTNLAYHKREIAVFGGTQLRPNIHINDMVDAYFTVLDAPAEIVGGETYNVGWENQSVLELAETIRDVVGEDVNLITTPSDDNRSYHISSEKIKKDLGFIAQCTIKDAAKDLIHAFKAGMLPNALDDERYFNVKQMQKINLS